MKKIYIPFVLVLLLGLVMPLHYAAGSPALPETNLMAADTGGDTVFAYFKTGLRQLIKSEYSGWSWTADDLGTGINGSPLAALEISPSYGTDMTLLAATSNSLFRSTDGGKNFNRILELPYLEIEGDITSVAISPSGNRFLVGTSTGDAKGGILSFDGEEWSDLEIGEKDVYAVAFSPQYLIDYQVVACTGDGKSVRLENRIGGNAWNEDLKSALLYSDETLTVQSASIAFPENYLAYEVNWVFAGVNGEGSGPDLYRVRFSQESTQVDDLDLNGDGTTCNVHSVAIAGTVYNGHIAAGLADSNMVKRSSNMGETAVTWTDSSLPPDGSANVGLIYKMVDGPTYYWLYAVTTGTGYGVFYSDDFGDKFYSLLKPVNDVTPIEDLQVTDETQNSISLSWTRPENTGEGDRYDIRCLESGPVTGDNWNEAVQIGDEYPDYSQPTQTFTMRGVQPEKTYYFAIKTGYEWTWSLISNSPAGTTLPAVDVNPPIAVEDLEVISSTSSSITLTWNATGDIYPFDDVDSVIYPPDGFTNVPTMVNFRWLHDEGSPSYEFQLCQTIDFNALIVDQTGLEQPAYSLPGELQYGTTYCWRVRSNYDNEYVSDWQTMVFTTMPLPSDHTEYDMRYSKEEINEENWVNATQCTGEPVPQAAGTPETFKVTGLKQKTTYYFAVKVSDRELNWSAMSNVASGTTRSSDFHDGGGDHIPPAPIKDLEVIETGPDTVTLQWTATGDDDYTGKASQYDVRYLDTDTLSSATWDSASRAPEEPLPQESGTVEKFTVTRLDPEVTYYFAIKAVDNSGNWSGMSNIASGTTLDVVPPAVITDLAVSGSTEVSITLTWTASGDDGMVGTASQYDIRYIGDNQNKDFETWKQAVNEPQPQPAGKREEFKIGNLSPGTTYYFSIRAADEVPNWAQAPDGISGRTQSAPAPSPTPVKTSAPEKTKSPSVPKGSAGGVPPPQDIHRDEETAPAPIKSASGPHFAVTDLTISKDKASTGETVQVTATVTNTGDQPGGYVALLNVDGDFESRVDVDTIAPGASDTAQFEFKRDAAGIYDLQVGEMISSVEVTEPVRAWIWIIVALAILLIILLILRQVLHWGFKRDKEP